MANTKYTLTGNSKIGYTATCISLDVVSEGETKSDVIRNIQEAIALHLEVAKEIGLS